MPYRGVSQKKKGAGSLTRIRRAKSLKSPTSQTEVNESNEAHDSYTVHIATHLREINFLCVFNLEWQPLLRHFL